MSAHALGVCDCPHCPQNRGPGFGGRSLTLPRRRSQYFNHPYSTPHDVQPYYRRTCTYGDPSCVWCNMFQRCAPGLERSPIFQQRRVQETFEAVHAYLQGYAYSADPYCVAQTVRKIADMIATEQSLLGRSPWRLQELADDLDRLAFRIEGDSSRLRRSLSRRNLYDVYDDSPSFLRIKAR